MWNQCDANVTLLREKGVCTPVQRKTHLNLLLVHLLAAKYCMLCVDAAEQAGALTK